MHLYCGDKMKCHLIIVGVLVLQQFSCSVGHKVLFFPIPSGSHILMHAAMAEALVKHGHEAHIVKHQSIPVPSQVKNSGLHFVNYDNGKEHFTMTKNFTEQVGLFYKQSFHEIYGMMQNAIGSICSDLLSNETLYIEMEKAKYDFVIVDDMFGNHCLYSIPHRLNVPYGTLSVMPPIDKFSTTLQTIYLNPMPLSYYMGQANFLSRLMQVLLLNAMKLGQWRMQHTTLIENYIKDRPVENIRDLMLASKIWFVDMDPLIDVPKHSTPNIIYIGGLSTGPPKPLPKKMGAFADSAKDGLVVVSFGGSMTADFPQEQIDKLLKAFSSINFKVIMRLKNKPSFAIGKNIMLVDWLPQNDLLGHPNTVLFITHCGASSQNEAVYHGVPMLGFPTQIEQRFNARRFTGKGFGDFMDRGDFTVEGLVSMIKELTENPKYRTTVRKASAIMKDRKFSAGDEAVYWIDHVIKYGADHLIPYTAQLCWYEVLMLDIMAAILAVILLVLFVIIQCMRCCRRACCGGRTSSKQKTS